MKKLLIMFLVSLLALSFVACSDDDDGPSGTTSMASYVFTFNPAVLSVEFAKNVSEDTTSMSTNFRDTTSGYHVVLVGEPASAVLASDPNYNLIATDMWNTAGANAVEMTLDGSVFTLTVSAAAVNTSAWGDAASLNWKVAIISNGSWTEVTNAFQASIDDVPVAGVYVAVGGSGNVATTIASIAYDSETAGVTTSDADWLTPIAFSSGAAVPFLTVKGSTTVTVIPFEVTGQSPANDAVLGNASAVSITVTYSSALAAGNSYAATLITTTNGGSTGTAITLPTPTVSADSLTLTYADIAGTAGTITNFVFTLDSSTAIPAAGSAIAGDIVIPFSTVPLLQNDMVVNVTNIVADEGDYVLVGTWEGWDNAAADWTVTLASNVSTSGKLFGSVTVPASANISALSHEFSLTATGTWDKVVPYNNNTACDLTGKANDNVVVTLDADAGSIVVVTP